MLKLLLPFVYLAVTVEANGLGFLGCCGGPGPGPYPAGTMTPSGYPIYGMAPYASDSVAYSSPGSSYSYGSSGYGSSGGYYGGSGVTGGGVGSGGIDFDSIPYGTLPPGSNVQPIAIRYFSQAIPVDIDPARLRPLGPTQLMRMPVYGQVRSYQSQSAYQPRYNFYQSTPNYYRPGSGFTSKYDKFAAHSEGLDSSRGSYQPAYSNWNPQPHQAVFRQSESGASSSSSSGYSSRSENIPPVSPAPAESSDSSNFPDINGSGSGSSSHAGSFQTGEGSSSSPQFRARAAAAMPTSASGHASALKPVSLQSLPRRSTGAENYKLSGEVLDVVNAVIAERAKKASI